MKQSRMRALDAGRGAAMLFVFLSHFTEYYLYSNGRFSQLFFLQRFTKIASPTFMIISGITLGYLFSIKESDFAQTRRKFLDRGLFLITIAHVLIVMSWIPMVQYFHNHILKVLFITDTIGFCLIVGPYLIVKVKPKGRLCISILLYSTSLFIISLGIQNNIYLKIISEIFFGNLHNSFFFDSFPILPWFSLYLLGTIIGEKVGFCHKNGYESVITILLLKIGLCLIGSSFLIFVLYKILKSTGIQDFDETIMALIFGVQKKPPGLEYFLFYSGVGISMLAILNKLAEKKLFNTFLNNLEIIGKTSLFAFIIQYFMYFSVVVWINPPYWRLWPLFFLATAFINVLFIRFWYRKGLNKYMTVLNLSVWKSIFKDPVNEQIPPI
jgi:uncharacterized membrane protein